MHDTPKAAHFRVTGVDTAIDPSMHCLGLRWRAADTVSERGVKDMLHLSDDDRRIIRDVCVELSTDEYNLVYLQLSY